MRQVRPSARRRDLVKFAVLALTVSVIAAGCTTTDERAEATEAARVFAKALSSSRLSTVSFVDAKPAQVQRQWDEAVAGLGDAQLDVSVAQVSEVDDEGAATATLDYAWDLAGTEKQWTYKTTARLVEQSEKWVVRWEPSLVAPALRPDEKLELSKEPARRGEILGADNVRLVTDRPVLRFGIDKTQVPAARQPSSARELASVLSIDPAGFVELVRGAGDKAFVEAIALRRDDVTAQVRSRYDAIAGAVAIPDEMPLAPTREFARPILGTVGPVTAEVIAESEGRYVIGDEAGLSGLQQRYDELLGGAPGITVTALNETTDATRELFRVRPQSGKPLRTTLDVDLQLSAEQLLADVGSASAIVAIRPSSGQIRAAASGPNAEGYSTATLGRYAPGSTFKVVSSLALLRAGLTPDSELPCTETTVANGKSFKNYDDYPAGGLGDITLRTAVANSCNTSFVSARDQASQQALAEAAASLGLGVDHDLGFPAYLGSVPASAPPTEHAASMIGQGKVLASPMAMAAVAASVAAGETVVPQLLPEEQPADGAPQVPLTSDEAAQLRELMGAVVSEGSADFLADVPGEPVLAKTGTAEFGTEQPLQTHAWMIGVHGDLAVAVFVEVGESGSSTAGPILETFLRKAG